MATVKQTKEIYRRIRYHEWNLQKALNEAHDRKIINYDVFDAEAPCWAMALLRERIEKSTMKARAQAFKDEIMKDLKGW